MTMDSISKSRDSIKAIDNINTFFKTIPPFTFFFSKRTVLHSLFPSDESRSIA